MKFKDVMDKRGQIHFNWRVIRLCYENVVKLSTRIIIPLLGFKFA